MHPEPCSLEKLFVSDTGMKIDGDASKVFVVREGGAPVLPSVFVSDAHDGLKTQFKIRHLAAPSVLALPMVAGRVGLSRSALDVPPVLAAGR